VGEACGASGNATGRRGVAKTGDVAKASRVCARGRSARLTVIKLGGFPVAVLRLEG